MNILVKFPTRNRPEKFKKCFTQWLLKLSGKHHVHFLISLHDDDFSKDSVIQDQYPLKPLTTLEFVVGKISTKIEAANFGLINRNFDFLVQGMDDLFPIAEGWDDIMAQDVERYFPCLDGVINYWDGHRPDQLPVVFSIGWNFFRRFPYLWNPIYVSVYADNELLEVATRLHKFISSANWTRETGNILMDHRHPYWTGEKFDALLQFTESFYAIDKVTFENQRENNFNLVTPNLSVLICCSFGKISHLKAVVSSLYKEIFNLPHPQDVEVLYKLCDQNSIEDNHNLLINIARGKEKLFFEIDDNDKQPSIIDLIKRFEVNL